MIGLVLSVLALAVAVLLVPRGRRLPDPSAVGDQARGPRGIRAAARTGVRIVVPVALPMLCSVLFGPFVAAAAAILGVTGWCRLRRRAGRMAEARGGAAMVTGLEVLVSELRIGAHPVAAFSTAAEDSPPEVCGAFRAVSARALLGADVPAGLRSAPTGPALREDWDRLAVFWQLATEHGLPIAMLMRAAQLDLMERQRFRDKVHAGMAGARATAGILAGLPLAGIALGHLVGAEPLAFLLGGGAGGVFLAAGVALVCVGLLWCDRITDRVHT